MTASKPPLAGVELGGTKCVCLIADSDATLPRIALALAARALADDRRALGAGW
jgi:hypothetical protein